MSFSSKQLFPAPLFWVRLLDTWGFLLFRYWGVPMGPEMEIAWLGALEEQKIRSHLCSVQIQLLNMVSLIPPDYWRSKSKSVWTAAYAHAEIRNVALPIHLWLLGPSSLAHVRSLCSVRLKSHPIVSCPTAIPTRHACVKREPQ